MRITAIAKKKTQHANSITASIRYNDVSKRLDVRYNSTAAQQCHVIHQPVSLSMSKYWFVAMRCAPLDIHYPQTTWLRGGGRM
jgi:hypothetical protein